MSKEYIIQCRYEWRSNNGILWTKWFAYDKTRYPENSVKSVLAKLKNSIKNIDNVSKLKHEYRPYDADMYEQERIRLIGVVKEKTKKSSKHKKGT